MRSMEDRLCILIVVAVLLGSPLYCRAANISEPAPRPTNSSPPSSPPPPPLPPSSSSTPLTFPASCFLHENTSLLSAVDSPSNIPRRHFLLTNVVSFKRTSSPFLGAVTQILRYCSPLVMKWSSNRLEALTGVDAALVRRSWLAHTARPCDLHILVDNSTMWDTLAALSEVALTLPRVHATRPQKTLLAAASSGNLTGGTPFRVVDELRLLLEQRLHVGVWLYDTTDFMGDPLTRSVAQCAGLKENERSVRAAWFARFLAFTILAPEVPAVLSLDLDVLILGNLDEMFCNLDAFSEEQLWGLSWEMMPTYAWWGHLWLQGHPYNMFHLNCPNCRLGHWDSFRGLNGGIALMHLQHLRSSRLLKAVLGNQPALCNSIKLFATRGSLWFGDQDLYNFLALMHPEMFYILPCEWNYQLCNYFRFDNTTLDHGCPYLPKLYHRNCNTGLPQGGLGVYYSWGSTGLTVHEVQRGDAVAASLRPSLVGSRPPRVADRLSRNCSCIEKYAVVETSATPASTLEEPMAISKPHLHIVLSHHGERVQDIARFVVELVALPSLAQWQPAVFIYSATLTNDISAIVIYQPGSDTAVPVEIVPLASSLKSVLDEASYLRHIMGNYKSLPAYVLFTGVATQPKGDVVQRLAEFNSSVRMMGLASVEPQHRCDRLSAEDTGQVQLGELYTFTAHRLCDESASFVSLYGGSFVVSGAGIQHHTRATYAMWKRVVDDSVRVSKEEGEEEEGTVPVDRTLTARFLDRLWTLLFGCFRPLGYVCLGS